MIRVMKGVQREVQMSFTSLAICQAYEVTKGVDGSPHASFHDEFNMIGIDITAGSSFFNPEHVLVGAATEAYVEICVEFHQSVALRAGKVMDLLRNVGPGDAKPELTHGLRKIATLLRYPALGQIELLGLDAVFDVVWIGMQADHCQ
ncbi:hypothetical protein PG987_009741 [Apiospora arundinis]